MRIIAGQFKGHPLKAPKTRATRPTSDRARETLFNIIAHAPWSQGFENARVLDLFAGSGALGLEALSRGAASATFVENARPAGQAMRENIKALGVEDRTELRSRSALSLGVCDAPFDLIFLDPPYEKGLVEAVLPGLIDGGWVAENGLIIAETEAGLTTIEPQFNHDPTGIEVVQEKISGAAKFWFLKIAGS